MTRRAVRTVFLSNTGDFCNGMAAAWAFAFFDALHRLAWPGLFGSLLSAILAFSTLIGFKLKLYDKHS